jgi:mannose-6-phosphate isomerase-like protein (cupin superfamily)
VAGYTKVNLKSDVDDQAPNFGLAPDLEARMARVPLEMENAGISYQRIAPNFRVPFGHKHKNQEEVYVVLSGSLRMKVEDEVHDLTQWDAVRVHKDTMRGFEGGPEGAEILAIGAPNTGPGDAEVVQDWWADSTPDSESES